MNKENNEETKKELLLEDGNNPLTPRNLPELKALATHLTKSGFLGLKNESEALTLMMLAQSEGKNLVQACMDYNIIQGKPALTSQATLTRFQQAGGRIKYIERSDTKVIMDFTHSQAGEITIEWTIDRAKKAGLLESWDKYNNKMKPKDNWLKYPCQMLNARCIAEGVRALFPACLGGVYLVEEVMDFPTTKQEVKKKEKEIDFEVATGSEADGVRKWVECNLDYLIKAFEHYTQKNHKAYMQEIDKAIIFVKSSTKIIEATVATGTQTCNNEKTTSTIDNDNKEPSEEVYTSEEETFFNEAGNKANEEVVEQKTTADTFGKNGTLLDTYGTQTCDDVPF